MGNSATFATVEDQTSGATREVTNATRTTVGGHKRSWQTSPTFASRPLQFKALIGKPAGPAPAPTDCESFEFGSANPNRQPEHTRFIGLSSAQALAAYAKLASSFPWKTTKARTSSVTPNPDYVKHLLAVKSLVNRYPIIVDHYPDAAQYLYR
jgi:hypothetical protein